MDACRHPVGAALPWKSTQRFIFFSKPAVDIMMDVLKVNDDENFGKGQDASLLTFAYKYRRKKSNKKLFPLRKAPATDTITTSRFLMLSWRMILVRSFSAKRNVCASSLTLTIWIAAAVNIVPPVDILMMTVMSHCLKAKQKRELFLESAGSSQVFRAVTINCEKETFLSSSERRVLCAKKSLNASSLNNRFYRNPATRQLFILLLFLSKVILNFYSIIETIKIIRLILLKFGRALFRYQINFRIVKITF